MNQTSKFDLAIFGLVYVGLPFDLPFEKSGLRLLEDHAVANRVVAAAGLGLPQGVPTTSRSGRDKNRFGSASAGSNDQGR